LGHVSSVKEVAQKAQGAEFKPLHFKKDRKNSMLFAICSILETSFIVAM
jgi:hypothetical protein